MAASKTLEIYNFGYDQAWKNTTLEMVEFGKMQLRNLKSSSMEGIKIDYWMASLGHHTVMVLVRILYLVFACMCPSISYFTTMQLACTASVTDSFHS